MYIFGEPVKFPIEDVTPTYLSEGVLSTLRQADFKATSVLHDSGCISKLSQMPVVIIPIHFDRDPVLHQPSCQRSIVIRTFITNDFMTGIAAQPDKHLPVKVRDFFAILFFFINKKKMFCLLAWLFLRYFICIV